MSGPRWACLMVPLLVGCLAEPHVPLDGYLPLGNWGGEGVGVIATDSVTHVHIGCTFGDVPGRLAVEPTGRFLVDGSFVLQAYPVLVGPSFPARFSGRLVGNTLTLSVEVTDTVAHQVVRLGPVVAVFGREPKLGPCPICIVPRRAGDLAPERLRLRAQAAQ